MGTMNEEI